MTAYEEMQQQEAEGKREEFANFFRGRRRNERRRKGAEEEGEKRRRRRRRRLEEFGYAPRQTGYARYTGITFRHAGADISRDKRGILQTLCVQGHLQRL